MVSFKRNNISITYESGLMSIVGSIDVENPGRYIGNILEIINDEILIEGTREITLDLRKLEYVNSSGIRLLHIFIMNNKGFNGVRKYKIKFLLDLRIEWQYLSAYSLLYMDVDNEMYDEKNNQLK